MAKRLTSIGLAWVQEMNVKYNVECFEIEEHDVQPFLEKLLWLCENTCQVSVEDTARLEKTWDVLCNS